MGMDAQKVHIKDTSEHYKRAGIWAGWEKDGNKTCLSPPMQAPPKETTLILTFFNLFAKTQNILHKSMYGTEPRIGKD